MARRKRTPALNDGHTLHLADEYHPDHRIAARAADAKAKEAAKTDTRSLVAEAVRIGQH